MVDALVSATKATPRHPDLDQRLVEQFFSHDGELGQISTPTTVVCGANDAVFPADNSIAVADRIPNSSLRILDNVGHALHIEAPAALAETLPAGHS